MRRKTYQLSEEERELIYEDVLNEQLLTTSYIDYQSPDQTHGLNVYDDNGWLIKEVEYADGIETSRTEIVYNEKGDVLQKHIYVADELFDEVSIEYFENGHAKIIKRMGEEIERYIERNQADTFIREYFQEGKLVELQESTYDVEKRLETVKSKDKDGETNYLRYLWYDEVKRVVKVEDRNINQNRMYVEETTYSGDNVAFEKVDDFINDQYYEVSYEYDQNGNEISMEMKSPTGTFFSYQKRIFNDQNLLISEHGYSQGRFNAIYGSYVDGNNYHFEHEYEED